MGSEFTFCDFVDGSGNNVIHDWLQTIPKKAKQKFNKQLDYLEATPLGMWSRPFVDTLSDELFEVRVRLGTQQYRILGAHTGAQRMPILLYCFIKPDRKVPEKDCDRAKLRLEQFLVYPAKHMVEHNYE